MTDLHTGEKDEHRMYEAIMSAWECRACEVEGLSDDSTPTCWNCGGPVTVTARPVVRSGSGRHAG